MQQKVAISIEDLNHLIKQLLESNIILNDIWITGEISQFKHYAKANHYYFNLTDGVSTINCVMYSSFIRLLQFKPTVGQKIFARGKIQFFQNKGSLIFQTAYMTLDGIGNESKQLEQLKQEFTKLGYFDQKNKQPIPNFPMSIALITASDSAAMGDFITTLRQHNNYSQVYLIPTTVQGDQASLSIIESLDLAIAHNVDVIALVRGGGSNQDLSTFNNENLCKNLFNCPIPIVTGIGHQTDTSLVDLIADKALVTPTACADYLVASTIQLKQSIQYLLRSIPSTFQLQHDSLKQHVLSHLKSATIQTESKLSNFYFQCETMCDRLFSFNPLQRLNQGYSITSKNSKAITSVLNLKKNDMITTTLADGTLVSQIKECNYEKQKKTTVYRKSS